MTSRWLAGSISPFKSARTTEGGGEASTMAMNRKETPNPHESSVWEVIKGYIKSRPVVIALLPAAFAVAFIPVWGEAADAADLAALCTESVDSIEMAEASSSSLTEVSSGLAKLLKDAAKLKGA
ncbi:hypothetical protein QQS21_000299 [Conoideocrella luteorostrata]|uniref:Uncharacterized protein n=1 Tax=Conoideocrella luteorostrata TaxID=1105319 RepID=A0AAJ0G2L2_9HYPO|nr:hypothetical protein QQS21_000299 [Conoideocrella luteorostrata]